MTIVSHMFSSQTIFRASLSVLPKSSDPETFMTIVYLIDWFIIDVRI